MSELRIEDVAKMVAVFKVNYNAYKGASDEEIDAMIEIWVNRLKQYPQEVILIAFSRILETSKFAPTLANFIEQIEAIQESTQESEFELWGELSEAIYQASILAGRFNCDGVPLGETKTQAEISREQLDALFSNLHPIIKEYVVSKQGLLDLADSDAEFERNRFIKTVPRLRARLKIKNETPEEIKNLLQGVKIKQITNEEND